MSEAQLEQLQKTNGFISKLQKILSNQEYAQIIRWKGEGCFEIRDIKAFEKTVLPLYFKHKKIPSFIRQLNMYSFHKIRGVKAMTFKNADFQIHGSPQFVCRKKVRQKPKSEAEVQVKKEAERDPSINLQMDHVIEPVMAPNLSLINLESGEIIGIPSFCSIFMGEHVPFCYN